MKKLLTNLTVFLLVNFSYCQVGINTENPQQIFHIDGKSSAITTNPSTGLPSLAQQVDDVVVTSQGRVGVGITDPTESLDINGKARIRNTELLTSTSVFPVFVDENGVLGKANLSTQSQIAFFTSNSTFNATIASFNNGDDYIIPIQSSHVSLNTIGATVPSAGSIRISSDGIYMISGSVTPQLNFVNDGDGFAYIAVNLDTSIDNGVTWTSVSGGRPIFPRVGVGVVRNYSFTIPTVIRNLTSGTFVRIKMYRTKAGTTLQGSSFNTVSIGSAYGAPSFTLSVSKL